MLEEIIKKLKPSKIEEKKVNEISSEMIKKIERRLNAEVMLAGSIAKGTWIRGNHDIDIFVLFPKNEKQIDKKLISSMKEYKKNVVHGSRDYLRFYYRGYKIEIVPLYKLSTPFEAKNSIDASQFHVKYIKEHINSKIADQVRLLKMFMKASGVYGAETYISGFSGYDAELMMLYFKTFENMVKFFDKGFSIPLVIDIENYYKNFEEIKQNLSKPKLESPMVIIDPTYKLRNASASLSLEAFGKFVFDIRMFKRKPSKNYFRIKKKSIIDIEKLSRRRGTLFIKKKIKMSKDVETSLAIAKSKLKKTINTLDSMNIKIHSYGILDKYAYMELETIKFSKYIKKYGPPVWINKRDFNKFLEKRKNIYVWKDRMVFDEKIDNIKKFVKKVMRDEFGY